MGALLGCIEVTLEMVLGKWISRQLICSYPCFCELDSFILSSKAEILADFKQNKNKTENRHIWTDYSTGVVCDRKCSCVTNRPDFFLASFPFKILVYCLGSKKIIIEWQKLAIFQEKMVCAISKGSKFYRKSGLQNTPPNIPSRLLTHVISPPAFLKTYV